jgi:hypothetical protein
MDVAVAGARAGRIELVTSPITLAECLVHPFRKGDLDARGRRERMLS